VASEEIIRFFIEEGKEHLDTLERGLIDLKASVQDPEMVNEMFRAAHSVKGGAAMLGFSSIQKTAHRFEDHFKVLKDTPIAVDQKLETLFLKGLDTLRELLEMLQGPFGLQEEEAEKVMQEADPAFAELQKHLAFLESGGGGGSEAGGLPGDFSVQVVDVLKQMLQVFRHKESSEGRQRLGVFCQHLSEIAGDQSGWKSTVEMAQKAIANSANPYKILAPFVIKELKQASDVLASNPNAELAPSSSLAKLSKIKAGAWSGHIILSLEPRAAAQTLMKEMNKEQLVKLAKTLYKAAQA
jgi:chemotaxis protein histidine kinase CheA